MLKKRLITAAILLPLAISSILYLPEKHFSVISGLLFCIGAWEWARLCGLKTVLTRLFYSAFVCQMAVLCFMQLHRTKLSLFLGLCLVCWGLFSLGIMAYPRFKAFWHNKLVGFASGLVVLVPAFIALNWLRIQHGPYYVLWVMALIWSADSGAYFAGKRFGVHKLKASVSPGKTWEGVAGALVGTTLLSFLGHRYLSFLQEFALHKLFMLNIITVIFSIFGDLFESLYKRLHHLKDSGTLFPGHGGVLDRMDSLTVALPLYLFGLNFL